MKKKSQEKDLDKDDKSDKSDKQRKDDNSKEDIKSIEESIDSKEKSDEDEKALFSARLCAYFIDVLVVAFIASLFTFPFADNKKVEDLEEQSTALVEKFKNNEINMNEYTVQYSNIAYDMAKTNGAVSLVTIMVGILYYVVFQIYNNGSTLGKKVFKIRVVSTVGDLSMNQMIFRSFIANSLLLDILSIMFIVFASRGTYFYCVGLFSIVQFVVVIISLFMIMYGKDGLAIHDRLVHTKVIKTK